MSAVSTSFENVAVVAVVPGRADQLEAGADVVEAGGHRRKVRADRIAVDRDNDEAQQQNHAVNGQIGVDVVQDGRIDDAAVHPDALHAARV